MIWLRIEICFCAESPPTRWRRRGWFGARLTLPRYRCPAKFRVTRSLHRDRDWQDKNATAKAALNTFHWERACLVRPGSICMRTAGRFCHRPTGGSMREKNAAGHLGRDDDEGQQEHDGQPLPPRSCAVTAGTDFRVAPATLVSNRVTAGGADLVGIAAGSVGGQHERFQVSRSTDKMDPSLAYMNRLRPGLFPGFRHCEPE